MPYFRLFYHIVWGTKYRLPLISDANRSPIYGAITAKVNQLGGMVLAIGGIEDHVHLLTTVPLSFTLPEFVGQIKGNASYIASHLPDAQQKFGWQTEYGVMTISELHLEYVGKYIQNQETHHAMNTLHPKLEMVAEPQQS